MYVISFIHVELETIRGPEDVTYCSVLICDVYAFL